MMVEERPPRDGCEEKLERLGWVALDHYALDGFRFGVRSTDAGFQELVRTYLGHLRVDDGKTDEILFSADGGVAQAMAGGKQIQGISTLYLGGLAVFRGPDRREMLGRLISSARDVVTSRSSEFVRIRGGAVRIDGSALLLPSMPEPHLPALVALLVGSGAAFIGDELVNIDPILRRVHGVPLPLLLDTGDLPLFPHLAPTPERRGRRQALHDDATLRDVTSRVPVSLDEIGGRPADPAPAGWIVFPSFRPGAPTSIEPARGPEVLSEFTRSGVNLNVWRERALILMRALVESVPVSRVVVGSIPEAADLLRRSVPEVVAEVNHG